MRTANRNLVYIYKALEQVNTDVDICQQALRRLGKPSQIDAYFDKFTIAFAKWLLKRNERTLEHSVEDLLKMYREYLSIAPDTEQIDFIPYEDRVYFSDSTHAPGGCPL